MKGTLTTAILISPTGKFYKASDDKMEEVLKPFEMSAEDVQALMAEVRAAKEAAQESGDEPAKAQATEVEGYLHHIGIGEMMPGPGPTPPWKKIIPTPMPTFPSWRIIAM